MQIDPSLHSVADDYKLLTNLVVLLPVAWITRHNPGGVINLAPFRFSIRAPIVISGQQAWRAFWRLRSRYEKYGAGRPSFASNGFHVR